MTGTSRKHFISLNLLLVVLIIHGFSQQCSAIQPLHMSSTPVCLVGNTEKHGSSEINPSKSLLGFHSHSHTKNVVHVRRSFPGPPTLYENAKHLFGSIKDSSNAWMKPGHEAAWEKEKFPRNVMIEYGNLANSGAVKQPHFLLNDQNREHWITVSSIPLEKHHAMRTWFGANMKIDGVSSLTAFDYIEWSARRAKSEQKIWWDWFEVETWASKTPEWQLMIDVGDLLRFEGIEDKFRASDEEISAIKTQLRNKMYEIEAPVKWNTIQPKIWGRYQVYEALSKDRRLMYNSRLEEIIGPVGPGTKLEGQVSKLGLENSIEEIEDVELHWLMRGLNPYVAKKLGTGLAIIQRKPSVEAKDLSPTEIESIKSLQPLINQRPHRMGRRPMYLHGEYIPEENWFRNYFGYEDYKKLDHKLESLYDELMPKQEEKLTWSSWLMKFLWRER